MEVNHYNLRLKVIVSFYIAVLINLIIRLYFVYDIIAL
jgi:hypothetical protein